MVYILLSCKTYRKMKAMFFYLLNAVILNNFAARMYHTYSHSSSSKCVLCGLETQGATVIFTNSIWQKYLDTMNVYKVCAIAKQLGPILIYVLQ